ncbi:MAG: mechanosensitive ion channel, partial [Helicobacter sp.]|nr:mechanosensitive ion channel [Helicobacter sp.]
MLLKRLFFVLFFVFYAYGENVEEELEIIKHTESEIDILDGFLNNPNNLWLKKYANYKAYQQVILRIADLQGKISLLQQPPQTIETQSQLVNLERDLNTLKQQKELLGAYKDSPFVALIDSNHLEDVPNVTNPIMIIQAFSYIKRSNKEVETLKENYQTLRETLDDLHKKDVLLNTLLTTFKNSVDQDSLRRLCLKEGCMFSDPEEIIKHLKDNAEIIRVLETTQNIFSTTLEIFSKETEESNEQLKGQIKAQIVKGIYIGVAFLILTAIALFTKFAVRKYIHNNERIYTANKIINFLNITLIIFILLFAYLDNVGYLVTVLGFASAGLAIAMKDLFMSVLGWFVIIIGGAVDAGDR